MLTTSVAPASGLSRSFMISRPKAKSRAVRSVPSAHFTSGLIFHVAAIRPSGSRRAVPRSSEGSSTAMRGSGAGVVFAFVTRPCIQSSLKDCVPPPLVPTNA